MDSDIPLDRGWAWFTVVGTFLNQMFVVGGARSFGVIFVHMTEHFNASSTSAALAMALMVFGLTLYSPIATALANKYSFRAVTMIGAGMQGLSFFLASFAPNIYVASFTIGILDGIAVGFLYTPSMSVIGKYFVKKRSIAVGLASSGTAAGQLTIPLLIRFLLDNYGYSGAMLIYSAVTWNCLVASALFRPQSFYKRKCRPKRERIASESNGMDMNGHSDQIKPLPRNVKQLSSDESMFMSRSSICSENPPIQMTIENENLDKSLSDIGKEKSCCDNDVAKTFKMMFDPKILKRPNFIFYTLSVAFANTAVFSSVAFLPAISKEIGLNKQDASLILAISGFADIPGRVFSAIFNHFQIIKTRHFMSLTIGIIATTIIVCLTMPSFASFVAIGVALGTFGGMYLAVFPVYLLEFMGPAKFPSAFAMCMAFVGIFNFLMPLCAGAMADGLGSYFPFMYLTVTMQITGIVFLQLDPVGKKIEKKHLKNIENQDSVSAAGLDDQTKTTEEKI